MMAGHCISGYAVGGPEQAVPSAVLAKYVIPRQICKVFKLAATKPERENP